MKIKVTQDRVSVMGGIGCVIVGIIIVWLIVFGGSLFLSQLFR